MPTTSERARRLRFKEQGLCRCGRRKPIEGRAKCQECLDAKNKLYTAHKIKGLCVNCGKQSLEGRTRCEECVDVRRQKTISNVTNGLCFCGRQPVKGKKCCIECTNTRKKLHLNRKSQGLCRRCGKSSEKIHCLKCLDDRKQISLRRKAEGLCCSCGKRKPVNNRVQCRVCSLKATARMTCGLSKFKELGLKLHDQSYRCVESGTRIHIGEDAALDHFIPKSKGGTNELDNLRWVHHWINSMKGTMSNADFQVKLDDFLVQIVKFRFGIDIHK
jgi:hypothetical protein